VLSPDLYRVGRDTAVFTSDGDQRLALAGITRAADVLGPVGTTRIRRSTRCGDGSPASLWKRVVIVTSPFHTRRACACLREASASQSRARASTARSDRSPSRQPLNESAPSATALYETGLVEVSVGWVELMGDRGTGTGDGEERFQSRSPVTPCPPPHCPEPYLPPPPGLPPCCSSCVQCIPVAIALRPWRLPCVCHRQNRRIAK
jgi:hypothetical protein